jgi:hypothetical protein
MDIYCNLCLSPLALCPCYSKLSQRMPSADFATPEIGATERPVLASSPQYQRLLAIHTPFYFMADLLSGTQLLYNVVALALPLPIPEFGEGDMINAIGLSGQPHLLSTDPTVAGVGATGPPPQPVVASPSQVSAANRRRTNLSPRLFVCCLCPRDFTAKHNLRS